MKRNIKLLSLILVIATMLTAFSSCASLFGGADEEGEGKIPTLDSKDSNVMFMRNDVAVAQNSSTQFYIPHQAAEVKCIDSFTDGQYNYYCYYLGYLENFPLRYSTSINHEGTIKQTYERTLSAESQNSIEDSVSNSVTFTNTHKWESKIGVELGFSDLLQTVSFKIGASHTQAGEDSTSTSKQTTHSVAQSWSESSSNNFQLTLEKDDPKGEYRYVHYTKQCDVYVVVVYDLNKKDFVDYEYLTYADESIKNSVVMVEYSPDGNFNSNNESKLTFDYSLIDSIDTGIALENRAPKQEVSANIVPIDIPVVKHQCKKRAENYDPNTTGDSGHGKIHNGWEMGHLQISGCSRGTQENYFNIKAPKLFSIKYVFEKNPHELGSDAYVSDDSTGAVVGMNLNGKQVEMGAYQAIIYRKDGSGDPAIIKTNFMDGKKVGDEELILGNIENPETILKINIIIVYEITDPGGASIFDGGTAYTNWRSDYTFYFNGATPDDFAN